VDAALSKKLSGLGQPECQLSAPTYHAIEKVGNPALKWLNMKQVVQNILRPGERLDEVHFFTAVWPYEAAKQKRHENFIAALEAYGVHVHRGKFSKPQRWCERHARRCPFREEKQTDVGIAVKMLSDALAGRADRMILVTADSDQIPTAKALREIAGISLTLAFPPGRSQEARELGNLIPDRLELHPERLLECKLPRTVRRNGKVIAIMPALYAETPS
jgi:uncharacterized LabA/DUF88 family protein